MPSFGAAKTASISIIPRQEEKRLEPLGMITGGPYEGPPYQAPRYHDAVMFKGFHRVRLHAERRN